MRNVKIAGMQFKENLRAALCHPHRKGENLAPIDTLINKRFKSRKMSMKQGEIQNILSQ